MGPISTGVYSADSLLAYMKNRCYFSLRNPLFDQYSDLPNVVIGKLGIIGFLAKAHSLRIAEVMVVSARQIGSSFRVLVSSVIQNGDEMRCVRVIRRLVHRNAPYFPFVVAIHCQHFPR